MALKQSTSRRVGFTAAAWLVGFLIFFPILWMFLTSFKTEADAYAIPPKFLFFHWTTENYAEVQSRAGLFPARLQFDRAFGRRQSRRPRSSRFPPHGRWPSRRPSAPRIC